MLDHACFFVLVWCRVTFAPEAVMGQTPEYKYCRLR
jgi:hypothetical protein